MIDFVEKFLEEHKLLSPDKTFLVGFSGGYDSLCMLDILNVLSKKYGFKLVALHLNHNWRGEESKQEELNCKKYCDSQGIDLVCETLVNGLSQKNESFAREARYKFFMKHAKNYSNSAIFTAHTKTDNAETIIYRIIKGTGIRGLHGIPQERVMDGIPIYRPLLAVSRPKIEDYCHCKGLNPNIDSSNFDISYKRNFIRHKIIPLFDEINFHAEDSINSLSKMAVSQSNIVDEYMDIIRKDVYDGERLLTSKFIALSSDVQKKLIYDACIRKDVDYDREKIENIIQFILENAYSKAGSRLSITNCLWLFVNSKYIYTITETKCQLNKTEISISTEGKWPFSEKVAFSLQKYTGDKEVFFPGENAPYAFVNLEETGLELTVRTRREGDYIVPFGMTGTMKLKKYLNAKGVSQHEKDALLLLCKGAEVLWVAKVGLSNKLKVVKYPTHVIKLEDRY